MISDLMGMHADISMSECYDMYLKKHKDCKATSLILVMPDLIYVYTVLPNTEQMNINSVFSSDKKIYSHTKVNSARAKFSKNKDILFDLFKNPLSKHYHDNDWKAVQGYSEVTTDAFDRKIKKCSWGRLSLMITPVMICGMLLEACGLRKLLTPRIHCYAHSLPIVLTELGICIPGIIYLITHNFRAASDEKEFETDMALLEKHSLKYLHTDNILLEQPAQYIDVTVVEKENKNNCNQSKN